MVAGKDTDFAWGLIGPGQIAHQFAQALQHLPHTYLHTVAGRSLAKAQDFAATYTQDGAPASYATDDVAALLRNPAIDAIYIATPHAQHGDFIRQCLLAGKPVLCEKPMVPTAAQAQALVDLAIDRNVFLMEALWSRFLPIYAVVGQWLRSGAIGKVCAVQSSFCFVSDYDPASRLYSPQLAGGSLLDIGIYNLAMGRWALQNCPSNHSKPCPEPLHLAAQALLAPTGVDQRLSAQLSFAGGVSLQFVCGFDAASVNSMQIMGTNGSIVLERDFWQATAATLHRKDQPALTQEAPFRINGFEGEIEEAMRCVRAGLQQSPHMPHSETLALVRWMDALRARVGVKYPFE